MSENICVRLGARIRELRVEKGWRQVDLGQLAGIHAVHISAIERGATEIGFRHLAALATALDITLSALVKDLS